MAISPNQATQVKEVFLKKTNSFYQFFFLFLFFFYTDIIFANKSSVQNALDYIYKTTEFSSDFLQYENNQISEGKLYLKDKRIKIQYESPTKIQIIMSKNKAMYFNQDLEEVEYFNPKKSVASFFFNIFNDENFFNNAIYQVEENFIKIEKQINTKDGFVNLIIIFEDSPIVMKKIIIDQNEVSIEFNILNLNFNPELDKKFFSMVNPLSN